MGRMEKHLLYSKVSGLYDLAFLNLLGQGNQVACQEMGRRGIREILEIGIGTGFSLDHYPPETKVTGVDLNPSMLERARQRSRRRSDLNVEFHVMDATKLAFTEGSFESVFLPSVLTVVPDPKKTLSEAVRVLKPGGTLFAICHLEEKAVLPTELQRRMDPMIRQLFGFTLKLSQKLFEDAPDLEIESIQPTNYMIGRIYPLSFLVIGRKADPRGRSFRSES